MKIDKENRRIIITNDELHKAFSSPEKYRKFIRKLEYTILTKLYGYSKELANYTITQWDFDLKEALNNAQT